MKQELSPKQIELLNARAGEWTLEEASRELKLPVGHLRSIAAKMKIVFKSAPLREERSVLSTWWGAILLFILINILCFAAYYRFQSGDFLYDDRVIIAMPRVMTMTALNDDYLLKYNPETKQYDPKKAILHYPTSRYFVWLAWNLAFNPDDPYTPERFHFLNYVFHIFNVLLLYIFLRAALVRARRPIVDSPKTAEYLSAAVALIFAVHPVQAASVAYVSSLSGVMEMFFALVMLLCFQQARKSAAPLSYTWYAACCLLFAVGMGCKESAIMYPLFLLAYLLIFETSSFAEYWKKFALPTIAFFVFIFIGEALAIFLKKTPLLSDLPDDKFWPIVNFYLVRQPAAIAEYYLPRLLLPIPAWLSGDPDLQNSWKEYSLLIPFGFVLLGGIIWFGIKSFTRYPLVTFGLVWFLGAMIPTSTLVPQNDLAMEHRLYLASIGFFVAMVWLAYFFAKKYNAVKFIPPALTVVLLLFCYGAYQRTQVFQSDGTFWEDVAKKNPNNYRAWINLGRHWCEGKYERISSISERHYKKEDLEYALICLEKVDILHKQIPKDILENMLLTRGAARRNLSRIMLQERDKYPNYDAKKANELSMRDYEDVLRINPRNPIAMGNIASIYADEYASTAHHWRLTNGQEDFVPVEDLFQKTRNAFLLAIKNAPESNAVSYINLAKIEFMQGHLLLEFMQKQNKDRSKDVLFLFKESAGLFEQFEAIKLRDNNLRNETAYMPMLADLYIRVDKPEKSWETLDRFLSTRKKQMEEKTQTSLTDDQAEQLFQQDRILANQYYKTRRLAAMTLGKQQEFAKYDGLLKQLEQRQ